MRTRYILVKQGLGSPVDKLNMHARSLEMEIGKQTQWNLVLDSKVRDVHYDRDHVHCLPLTA